MSKVSFTESLILGLCRDIHNCGPCALQSSKMADLLKAFKKKKKMADGATEAEESEETGWWRGMCSRIMNELTAENILKGEEAT